MTANHSSLSLRSKCFVSEWEGDTRMKDKKAQIYTEYVTMTMPLDELREK